MLTIDLPEDFNKEHLFQYLRRSADEISFTLDDESIFKLFFFEGDFLLCKISFEGSVQKINFLNRFPSESEQQEVADYVIEWFDLKTDLQTFYRLAAKDKILKPLIGQFQNLRMARSPDLFEALCWSIIGQQINLPFAYQCKRRLIEHCNHGITFKGKTFYSFPTPKQVLSIEDAEFLQMKFSRHKVKYLRIVAEAFETNTLSKKELQSMPFKEAENRLTTLKGIGQWSANYVLMRCLGFKEAFPIADVGLHNALKNQLQLELKPSIEEIQTLVKRWKGWEAYATFYLWQSLL